MSELGPLDHISRPPLPWRDPKLTECGKDLSAIDPQRILTREQVKKRIGDVGQKRAAYTTCMTCATTSDRYPQDLINAVCREAEAVRHQIFHYGPAELELLDPKQRIARERDRTRRDQLSAELEAVQALIEAHREEFDGYLSGLDETVKLADRRSAKRPGPRWRGSAL